MNFIGAAAYRMISLKQISTKDSRIRVWDGFNSSWKGLRGWWHLEVFQRKLGLKSNWYGFRGSWEYLRGSWKDLQRAQYWGLSRFYLFLLRSLLGSPKCHWNPSRLFHELYRPDRSSKPLWPFPKSTEIVVFLQFYACYRAHEAYNTPLHKNFVKIPYLATPVISIYFIG